MAPVTQCLCCSWPLLAAQKPHVGRACSVPAQARAVASPTMYQSRSFPCIFPALCSKAAPLVIFAPSAAFTMFLSERLLYVLLTRTGDGCGVGPRGSHTGGTPRSSMHCRPVTGEHCCLGRGHSSSSSSGGTRLRQRQKHRHCMRTVH